MTFIEILNNPETKQLVEGIEDLQSSLNGKQDETLERILKYEIENLFNLTGFNWA